MCASEPRTPSSGAGPRRNARNRKLIIAGTDAGWRGVPHGGRVRQCRGCLLVGAIVLYSQGSPAGPPGQLAVELVAAAR